MERVKYNESEILDAYFEAAGRSGILERKAELLYPDFDISAPKQHEIQGIRAVASYDNRILSLAEQTMADEAHPDGSVRLDVPGDKVLATVEDLADRAKVMREVAERNPTGKVAAAAVAQLLAVADLLDAAGLSKFAATVDSVAADLARDEAAYNASQPKVDSTVSTTPTTNVEMPAAKVVGNKHAVNNNKALDLLNKLIAATLTAQGKTKTTPDFRLDGVWTPAHSSILANDYGIKNWKTWGELFGQMQAKLVELQTAKDVSAATASGDAALKAASAARNPHYSNEKDEG